MHRTEKQLLALEPNSMLSVLLSIFESHHGVSGRIARLNRQQEDRINTALSCKYLKRLGAGVVQR